MTHLFDPLTLKDITLRNRIGVSPMCQYSYLDGFSNDWQVVHLGARAVGGAGLVIVEATAVEPRGRITPFDAGIWSDAHVKALTRVVQAIKMGGAVPGIQIAHAGRKACARRPWEEKRPYQPGDDLFWTAVGASPLAFAEDYQIPRELEISEILQIQDEFAAAAQRSLATGFEWLEIHAAHGYLIQSFLSPLSNHRMDAYGGSFENRVRLLVEVVQKVRKVWPERLPLTVRISGTEWVEGGWSVEDSVNLAILLKAEGVDLLDCSSSGNISTAVIPTTPGYQVFISDTVRRESGLMTATVGLISDPLHAEEIIASGKADLVLLGRELLRNPTWPIQAARQLGFPAPIPPQYLRAYPKEK